MTRERIVIADDTADLAPERVIRERVANEATQPESAPTSSVVLEMTRVKVMLQYLPPARRAA